jgi:Cu+-exporting ATPase
MSNPSSREIVTFAVTGMTCGSCVNRITRALRKVDGVAGVKVDLRRETARVVRERDRASDASLAAAVVVAGYTADLASASHESVPDRPRPSIADRLLRRRRGPSGPSS